MRSLLFITVRSKGELSPKSSPFHVTSNFFPSLTYSFYLFIFYCSKNAQNAPKLWGHHFNSQLFKNICILTLTWFLYTAAFDSRSDLCYILSISHPIPNCQGVQSAHFHSWESALTLWEGQSWHSAKSIHCFYFCAMSRHKNILLGTKSHSWAMQSWTRLRSSKTRHYMLG